MKPVEVVLAIVLITLALEITSRYTHCFEFLIYRLFIHQWPGVSWQWALPASFDSLHRVKTQFKYAVKQ